MMNIVPIFHRPDLARRLTDQILVAGVGSAAGSGVFLAAPRRTGKSTFLREDLRPMLEAQGVVVVYADLWANPTADPGLVISNAIRAALAGHEGVMLRLARNVGMGKLSVGSMSFDLDRIGLGKDISLTDALVALSDETGQMIVLVIDEAQHVMTTDAGIAALFALKAARDELNSSLHHGLRIVCTGSNRDKLAMLRNSKDQAFFGAPLVNFPLLGRDYIDWFCHEVMLPFSLDPAQVWPLFIETGYRPELLGSAADQFRFEFEMDEATIPQKFADEVRRLTEELNEVQRGVIHSLTPIQSAVLRVMAAADQHYAPFEAATLEKYRKALQLSGQPPEEVKVDVPGVQQALIALQDKKLIWRAARGVYAVEEKNIIDLLRADGLLDGLL
jgi:hypothetical protein